MPKLLAILAVAALLAALAVTGAGVASGTHLREAKTKVVHVGDNFYMPTKVKIKKGRRVKWTWGSGTAHRHTVTEENGKFSSKKKRHGTFKHRFKKVGTFHIFCAVHPETMRMKVVVRK